MAIHYQILGTDGADNALYVEVDSGQAQSRLLFDCGARCLDALPVRTLQGIDHLFFSHGHMDHIAGFDDFFRLNYDRITKPNRLWGPPGIAAILQHRFQGYWWNLPHEADALWEVTEIDDLKSIRTGYRLSEAFAESHTLGETNREDDLVVEDQLCRVRSFHLEHHGPCLAYRVDEKPVRRVNKEKFNELGLDPGPWVGQLLGDASGVVEVGERSFTLDELRAQLVEEKPGDSIAYLTDFRCEGAARADLIQWLGSCRTLVCEAQYLDADRELAERHHHMTARETGALARDSVVERLEVFHFSGRYDAEERERLLKEAQDACVR